MSAILNYLNIHNFLIFQPILMRHVSKFMLYRALSDKTYLLSGLRSPLTVHFPNKKKRTKKHCKQWFVVNPNRKETLLE